MKKIILSALIATTAVGSTLANAPSPAFSGAYIGGGLDYSREKFNAKVNATVGGQNFSESRSSSLTGGGFKGFVGYGAIFAQGFYLGGELTLGYDRAFGGSKKKEFFTSNGKANYGIAARVGYAIDSVLPYLKFGYEGRPSVKVIDNFSIRRSGFILGGGADVAVNKNVFVRVEYVHGFGAKSNVSGSAVVAGVPVNAALNVKTTSDTFLIGAGYRF